jgi:hypothetical protein
LGYVDGKDSVRVAGGGPNHLEPTETAVNQGVQGLPVSERWHASHLKACKFLHLFWASKAKLSFAQAQLGAQPLTIHLLIAGYQHQQWNTIGHKNKRFDNAALGSTHGAGGCFGCAGISGQLLNQAWVQPMICQRSPDAFERIHGSWFLGCRQGVSKPVTLDTISFSLAQRLDP